MLELLLLAIPTRRRSRPAMQKPPRSFKTAIPWRSAASSATPQGEIAQEFRRRFDLRQRLVEIDDVDAILLVENVLLHPGMPATGLVSEMDTGFYEFIELLGHE